MLKSYWRLFSRQLSNRNNSKSLQISKSKREPVLRIMSISRSRCSSWEVKPSKKLSISKTNRELLAICSRRITIKISSIRPKMVTLLTLKVVLMELVVIDEVALELEVLKVDQALLKHARTCLLLPTRRTEVEAPVIRVRITQKTRSSSPYKSIKDTVTTILALDKDKLVTQAAPQVQPIQARSLSPNNKATWIAIYRILS